LYFGNSGIELAREFRAAKQQVYTMLHLPFHLSLALTLEGLRTWAVIANVQYNFKKVYGYIDKVIGETPDVFRLEEFNATTGDEIVNTLNDTIKSFGFDDSASWASMQTALTKLRLGWQDDPAVIGTSVPGAGAQNRSGILKFYFTEFVSLVQNEQFVANSLVVPEIQVKAANASGVAKMEAYFAIFKMIFIYFFVCTAIVMFILGVFRSMSIGPRDKYDRMMITVRMAMGLLLGLLGLLALMNEHFTSYINSGVLLPTLLFVLTFGEFVPSRIPTILITNYNRLVVMFEKLLTIFATKHGKMLGLANHEDAKHEENVVVTSSGRSFASGPEDKISDQSMEKVR
jgi:hypothetical protein